MRLALALALLAGCDFVFRIDAVPDRPADAGIDALLVRDGVTPDGSECLGQGGLYVICDVRPTGAADYSAPSTINTSGNCDQVDATVTPPLCILEFTSFKIEVGSSVRVTGARPLVIVSTSTVEIDGALDASSPLRTMSGPGANTGCSGAGGTGTPDPTGAGGGAGGSFQGQGGIGGISSTSVGGGTAVATMPVTSIRGGCGGGAGGNASNGSGGLDGVGGGAIYIIARNSIALTNALIDASGSGGGGARGVLAGGGGGGAGGLIGLAAPVISVDPSSRICANGGAGGGGGGPTDVTSAPADGVDGYNTCAVGAYGGSGGDGAGGTGGRGSSGPTLTGLPGMAGIGATGAGGGGGGGGAGWIRTYPVPGNLPQGTSSPPAN